MLLRYEFRTGNGRKNFLNREVKGLLKQVDKRTRKKKKKKTLLLLLGNPNVASSAVFWDNAAREARTP